MQITKFQYFSSHLGILFFFFFISFHVREKNFWTAENVIQMFSVRVAFFMKHPSPSPPSFLTVSSSKMVDFDNKEMYFWHDDDVGNMTNL